jgi:iron complex outermembrane receptor protein
MYTRILILLFLGSSIAAAGQDLNGKVMDAATKEALPGASVYIPDLKTGAVTDVNGHYTITNLPKSRFSVQVKSLGYVPVTVAVDLSRISKKDFLLTASAVEAAEVVVTGSAFSSEQSRSSAPVVPIDRQAITSTGAGNIVSAIATTAGVSAVSTGEAISKPVIRGLGYNRIVTVNEGVRQEGQQWGDEHGIEIDEFSADRIEILKGPSSLLYGSDALGGVINILEPIPPPAGKIRGELNAGYATNNRLKSGSLMLEGNMDGIVWRARGTAKDAISYLTPAERVYNSGYEEKNAEAMIGLNRGWGYSHLHYSKWDSDIGFTEGNRDSTGRLLNASGLPATEEELLSEKIALPYQHVAHDKFSLVNNFIIGPSQLRVNAGWQQNERKEFDEHLESPGLWLLLKTITYDVRYYFPQDSISGIEAVIGAGGMSQDNENRGTEFLIPDYNLTDFGGFASVKKSLARTTFNAGIRYDLRKVNGIELISDSAVLFSALSEDYSAVSFSAGATFRIDSTWNLKANLGRGFRAPNISELSANGLHEGTFRYEVGNPGLRPETSLQGDIGISCEGKKASLSLDGFYNDIADFIHYDHLPGDSVSIDGDKYPIYRYGQEDAVLKGLELSIDFHPVENLHFESSVSFVNGTASGKPLPFMPPLRNENEFRYVLHTKNESLFDEPYIRGMLTVVSKQDKIAEFETVTPGYAVAGLGAGTGIRISKQVATLFVLVNNIADHKYFNHLSRLKDAGISEMGRNVVFGLTLPFGIR